jgi:hypothetical protein
MNGPWVSTQPLGRVSTVLDSNNIHHANFRRDLRRLLCSNMAADSSRHSAFTAGSSYIIPGQVRRKSSSRNTENCALLTTTSASQAGGIDLAVMMTPRLRDSVSNV